MNPIPLTILIVIITMAVLGIPFLTTDLTSVQGQNATSQNTNNTLTIINVTDKTVTLIDKTTNETISIRNLTEDTGNMITNETLSPTTGNMTTKVNLTEKFRELGK